MILFIGFIATLLLYTRVSCCIRRYRKDDRRTNKMFISPIFFFNFRSIHLFEFAAGRNREYKFLPAGEIFVVESRVEALTSNAHVRVRT